MSEKEGEKSGIFYKLNALRGKICRCDWTPAGEMKIQGNQIKYISIAQMKANLAPMFGEVGLEFDADMDEPQYNTDARCWVVGLRFTIRDLATNEEQQSKFYGSGEGSKGLAIAVSYALKMYLSTKFMLADGIDPDKEGIGNTIVFTPKTAKERDEVASKLDDVAAPVKPTATADPMTGKPKADTKPANPADKSDADDKVTYSALQNKTMLRYLKEHEGTDIYDTMKAEYDALRTPSEARAFIGKYKEN